MTICLYPIIWLLRRNIPFRWHFDVLLLVSNIWSHLSGGICSRIMSSRFSFFYTKFFLMAVFLPAANTEARTWSMYPELHDDVSCLLRAHRLLYEFKDVDEEDVCSRSYDTNVTGRFKCFNISCETDGWSSKVVAITIRTYPGPRYNARVYHQRCENCDSLSRPVLNKSYADRIAYRLKKWNGIQVVPPVYSATANGPHYSNLCEGCKAGHCNAGGRGVILKGRISEAEWSHIQVQGSPEKYENHASLF